MIITITWVGRPQTPLIALKGKLKSDGEDPEVLKRALSSLVLQGHLNIIVDLRELNEMGAAGFRVLVSAFKEISKKHGQLMFINIRGNVLESFKLGGFDKLFTIAEERPFI